jgi:hypothetical protein
VTPYPVQRPLSCAHVRRLSVPEQPGQCRTSHGGSAACAAVDLKRLTRGVGRIAALGCWDSPTPSACAAVPTNQAGQVVEPSIGCRLMDVGRADSQAAPPDVPHIPAVCAICGSEDNRALHPTKANGMTLFELVKLTLDELYDEAVAVYGANTDKLIKDRFAYLSTQYGQLFDPARKPIDYKDPATRFAYVYRYVATHGDYVVQLLTMATQSLGGKVFPDETARVSCIGGGPGSDILAVLKYLDDYKAKETVKKLVVYLLDKEQAWADTWTEMDTKLDTAVHVGTNFQPLDVTNPASWTSQKKFLGSDLFTLSYFVSEVYILDSAGVVSQFWQTLFKEAKPGAIFIYDDNGTDALNAYFDGQWQKAGLDLLDQGTNVRWTPRYTERADVLDSYKAKFSAWPKLQGTLSYRILRK